MGQMMAGTPWAYMGVLNEDQRASMREVLMEQRDKMRELEEKLRKARMEVLEAALSEKFNESAVRKKALEQAKIEAEVNVLRVKALSQVKPPLTPEQVERLKNPPAPQFGAPREGMRRPQGRPDPNGLPPRPEGDSPRDPVARPPAER
jgi:Spy/CpxP family protein refolding chaperone